MKLADKTLQIKIVAGYFIVLGVISSTIVILLQEKGRMRTIEADNCELRGIQREIQAAHRHITGLSMQGESVIGWGDGDSARYCRDRMRTDSLLETLKDHCGQFVRPGQIDTLRQLLAEKERHLLQTMKIFRQQERTDSLLSSRLPPAMRQATRQQEVKRKRKGIIGWLGGTVTIRQPASSAQLLELNRELIAMQQEHAGNLALYADSLQRKNRELNNRLMELVGRLDRQAEASFRERGEQTEKMRRDSFLLLSGIIALSLLLLIAGLSIILRDLRKLEKMSRQNTGMLEMRKKIILTLSHDIRGPLNAISGSAELAMDTREKKKRDLHLANVRRLCGHILGLLNNLLDVYRLNEAKETRNEVPFRLSELLEDTSGNFCRESNDKGILFIHEFKGTDVSVTGDTDRIRQITDNLLGNALKFTERGSIRLSASYTAGRLEMEISDTGIGMDKEQMERIFTPFERGTTHAEGFGLGLSITKGLVSLLDGTIAVTSRPGEGSTFRVSLPLPETDGDMEPGTGRKTVSMRLPSRVIAIDDDPLQLAVVKEMLERSGVSCHACCKVQEVVAAMRHTNFDLLLTDIQMGKTGGTDLLRLLRHSDIGNSQSIPVVAMTARGDKEKETLLRLGFDDCIYKPFSKEELLLRLSSLMKAGEEKPETTDWAALTAGMTDKGMILDTFIQELEKGAAQLEDALATASRDRMRDTLHRLWPMLETAKAEGPLAAYRQLLREGKSRKEEVGNQGIEAVGYLRQLMEEAAIYRDKTKNEEENTDSGRQLLPGTDAEAVAGTGGL